MKFRSKIVTFAAVPAVLFVIALVSSIGSLISTRSDFDAYIKSEQAAICQKRLMRLRMEK